MYGNCNLKFLVPQPQDSILINDIVCGGGGGGGGGGVSDLFFLHTMVITMGLQSSPLGYYCGMKELYEVKTIKHTYIYNTQVHPSVFLNTELKTSISIL